MTEERGLIRNGLIEIQFCLLASVFCLLKNVIPSLNYLHADAGLARPCSAEMRKDFAEQGRLFLREQAGRLSQRNFIDLGLP
jgi:hypothetical protein